MNKAMGLALAMKNKNMNQGGKCYACGGMTGMSQGGQVTEEDTEDMQPSGEWQEDDDLNFSEGGGVDEQYNPESANDPDGDSDDLVYSPEVSSEDVNSEEPDDDENKNKFLRAYAVSRRINGR